MRSTQRSLVLIIQLFLFLLFRGAASGGGVLFVGPCIDEGKAVGFPRLTALLSEAECPILQRTTAAENGVKSLLPPDQAISLWRTLSAEVAAL